MLIIESSYVKALVMRSISKFRAISGKKLSKGMRKGRNRKKV
jgi:hypothetical protein